MKKLLLLSLFLAACSSSSASWRDLSNAPEKLPGIPKSVSAHCRNESQRLIENNADDLEDLSLEAKACLDLRLQEDCLERMAKVAESKGKKTATVDPFFYKFPGAWDQSAFDDSLETLQTLAREGVCRDNATLRQVLDAARGLLGAAVGAGAYDWENRGHGNPGLNRCAELDCPK